MPKLRWLVCLSVVPAMAGYVLRAPREPFADRRWEIDSVMVLDPNVTQYKLDQPYKVFRDGRVTFSRQEETAPLPVLRLDLNIDGEHVIVFTRLRE